MDYAALQAHVDRTWRDELLSELSAYIRVPAKSPHFDADWRAHGHLQRVVVDAGRWARRQPVHGLQVEVLEIEGRTPCLLFEAPATAPGATQAPCVLFYGHLDKQPEMTGWRADGGPWTPLLEDGRLYGRGGADDGYAVYAALTALAALDAQGLPRPRCVGLIETGEESGSPDLPAYLQVLAPRLGAVGLVVGLDSGAGDYERLWITSSLRGLVGGVLSIDVLDEGVHSGAASGIVPSSFRIARRLLDRIDDPVGGEVLSPAFHARVPAASVEQARRTAALLGEQVWSHFPWAANAAGGHAGPVRADAAEALLARSWRPALSVTGADGLPPVAAAGNVLRPRTVLKLSLRLPPTVDSARAAGELKQLLERDPPYGARVGFTTEAADGWAAPPTADWLAQALDTAGQQVFGAEPAWIGEGGSIPFMGMLGRQFPEAQFLITGVLGPQSNAHGPNEFLHLAYASRLTAAVAAVVAAAPF